jgi:aconitase B
MMNSGFMDLHTRKFADRLAREAGNDTGKQVERAYTLALGRAPSQQERAMAVDFIKSHPKGLVDFCYTIFNLNEFAYIP